MGRRKTKKDDRFKLYLEQIKKLRIAWICCNNEMAREAVDMLISLNRRFENEDYPNEGN